jgi:hypothetical protein
VRVKYIWFPPATSKEREIPPVPADGTMLSWRGRGPRQTFVWTLPRLACVYPKIANWSLMTISFQNICISQTNGAIHKSCFSLCFMFSHVYPGWGI